MSQIIQIVLDDNKYTYQAGEEVNGHVVTNCTEDPKAKKLKIKLTGVGSVHWTAGNGDSRERRFRTERYIKLKTTFWQAREGGESFPLGIRYFPFSFKLPKDLPSSYADYFSSVEYSIQATIKRSWKFDFDSTVHIKILSHLDLQSVPEHLVVSQNTEEKELGFLFWRKGAIGATLYLPRSAFVAGEAIPISALIANESSRPVTRTQAELRMKNMYRDGAHVKYSPQVVVSKVTMDGIPAWSEAEWDRIMLQIPPTAVPTHLGMLFRPRPMIDLRYSLVFIVDPSGPHTDLEVEIPIVIGSTNSMDSGPDGILDPVDPMSVPRIGWMTDLDMEDREEEDESDIDSELDSEDD